MSTSLKMSFILPQKNIEEGYIAGELIEGELLVTPSTEIRCKAVNVSLTWRTSGAGNKEVEIKQTQKVYQGDLLPDQKYSFPFSLTLPEGGPFPYHGKHIQFDYYLEATVKISLFSNPSEKFLLKISPSPKQGIIYYSGKKAFDVKDLTNPPVNKFLLIIMTIYLGAILLSIIGAFLFLVGTFLYTLLSTVLSPMSCVMVMASIFMSAYFLFKRYFPSTRFRLKNTIFETPSLVVHPGETFPFGFSTTAKRPFLLRKISTLFVIEEEAMAGGGKSASYSRNKITAIKQDYYVEERVFANEEKKIMGQIQIPRDAPYLLELSSNSIKCTLSIEVYAAYCFSNKHIKKIAILPRGYIALPNSL